MPVRHFLTILVAQAAAFLRSLLALAASVVAYLARGLYGGRDPHGEESVVPEGGEQNESGIWDRQGSNKQYEEEDEFVSSSQDDADILALTDSIMINDSLLPMIWDAFKQRSQESAQSLSFILRLMTNRIGSQGGALLSPRIRCIPDLSLLSRRAWDTFMGMLAELTRRHPGPLLNSSPEWLHNTTLLLLSSSPYPLPEFAQFSLTALIEHPVTGPMLEGERFISIASWISRRPGDSEFTFRPLAPRLLPLFGDVTSASLSRPSPSLLTVLQVYRELLRPFCTDSSQPESLYVMLFNEQHLFDNGRARPILEDMGEVLSASIMYEGQDTKGYRPGTIEGTGILLEFGPRIGREAEAQKSFAALWASGVKALMALEIGFVALHQRDRAPGAHVLELITNAFLKSEGVSVSR